MKKLLAMTAVFALLAALLSGCTINITLGETTPVPEIPSGESLSTQPAETPTAQLPEQTEPAPSTEAPTQPTETVPPVQTGEPGLYLVTVTRADQPIYNGPGYDYTCVGTVRQAGIYTIMEEARDASGNLWGRLKSGLGWIDVTDVTRGERPRVPITAGYADEYLLLHGYYYSCVADDSEYTVAIAFRAQENLRDVCLYSLVLEESGYGIGQLLGTYPELPPDIPLVAWVSFPGDMSAYCIGFTDSTGAVRYYLVTISGKDGSVVLSEFQLS